jgi:hypothetical protein
MILQIYGEHFAGCYVSIPQNGPYPTEACGVRVLVGDAPAGLLFVSEKQVNLKIPADAPDEGTAPIRICVAGVCSDPVTFRFSSHKAYIAVQGTAYVHMPIWIEVDQPMPYDIHYPYQTWPWDFGGYQLEVRRNGQPLPRVGPYVAAGGVGIGIVGGTVAPQDSPRSRLPLHLVYRFDQPGTYSVKFTAWRPVPPNFRSQKIVCESDWTDIIVEPFSEAQRDRWLQAEAAKAKSATPGQLVGDVIPSLLALPDEKALVLLLPFLDHPNDLVRQFVRQSLSAFDPDLVHRFVRADLPIRIRR